MDLENCESDLEDGEIREDVLEDISDCSLSGIIHEDISDDNNADSLNNETVKTHQDDDPNEEEKCRLEALKSLLENTGFLNENDECLQGIDDLTEEEKLRMEAVKSLLRNTNFLATKKPPVLVESHVKKRKKRRKIKRIDSSKKRVKVEPESVEDNKPDVIYLKETTSLLSELSKDVKKINETRENKKNTVNTDTNQFDKENTSEINSSDSSLTVIDSVRSWYPKTEFSLLDVSFTRINEEKQSKYDDGIKVKYQINISSGQKSEKKPSENHSQKTELVSKSSEMSDTKTVMKFDKLPQHTPLNDNVTVKVEVKDSVVCEKSSDSTFAKKTENEVFPNSSTQPTRDLQGTKILKKISRHVINSTALIRSPKSKTTLSKLSTPCSFRKINPTPVISNGKNYSLMRKLGRYKLNNVPTAQFQLKKSTPLKIDKSKLKLNNTVKSRYSINRTNQYSKVNLKEFIIPLNDDDRDDSSKEEDLVTEPAMVSNSSEIQIEISPLKNVVDKEMPKIKEEPQDEPEQLPNDEFVLTELPSTTTADMLTTLKEECVQEPPDEPFDVSTIEIGEVSSLRCDTSSGLSQDPPLPSPSNEPENKTELDLLFEAEENLIEIRSKLLSSLGELDTSIKSNNQEKEKLLIMIKRLNTLKAAVIKLEDKVKTQKMKLAMSSSFTQSLYEGVMLRSKTCSKMKDLCSIAGKKIIGPLYRPPEDFESQLREKQKTLDFSKYVQKPVTKN